MGIFIKIMILGICEINYTILVRFKTTPGRSIFNRFSQKGLHKEFIHEFDKRLKKKTDMQTSSDQQFYFKKNCDKIMTICWPLNYCKRLSFRYHVQVNFISPIIFQPVLMLNFDINPVWPMLRPIKSKDIQGRVNNLTNMACGLLSFSSALLDLTIYSDITFDV